MTSVFLFTGAASPSDVTLRSGIALSVDGATTATATADSSFSVTRSAAGSTSGAATPTASENVRRVIAGSSTGSASTSGALRGAKLVSGSVTGSASPAATVETVVDSSGAVLAWESGPFAGLVVDVPAGALSSPTDLAPSVSLGRFSGFRNAGLFVQFPDVTFDAPVQVTLPVTVPSGYRLEDLVAVKRESGGRVRSLHPVSVDHGAGTITLETSSFSGFGGAIPANAHAMPCEDEPSLLTRIASTGLLARCECPPTWLAVFIIATSNDYNSDVGEVGVMSIVSVRADLRDVPAGTRLHIPATVRYTDSGTPVTSTLTLSINCGATTGGFWHRPQGREAADVGFTGIGEEWDDAQAGTFLVTWYAELFEDDAIETIQSQYGFPMGGYAVGSGSCPGGGSYSVNNPGPKLRDACAKLDSAIGAPSQSCGSDPPLVGFKYLIGALAQQQRSICIGAGPTYVNGAYVEPNAGAAGTWYHGPATCVLDTLEHYGPGPSNQYLRVFCDPHYTTPTGPFTTDDEITVGPFEWYNPFTGNKIDGTHSGDDNQEGDADVHPAFVIVDAVDGCEFITTTSTVRNAYGKYTLKCKLRLQAGTRKFGIYGHHVESTFFNVARYVKESDPLTITAGAMYCADLPPPNPTFDTIWFRIGELITIGGTEFTARLLDRVGDTCLYNVVPTATDNVEIMLTAGAGNAWTSPTLNGTKVKAAVSGIAHYDDITATALGNNYGIALKFISTYFRSSNDNWHEWPVGFTCGLAFEDAPGPIAATAGVDFDIKVDLVDYSGTPIDPSTQDDLTLSGAGSFTGFGTVTPASGVATFHGNFPAAGTYTIQVATSGTHYYGPGAPAPGATDNAIAISVVVT